MSNIDTVKEQLSNLISSNEFNNKSSEELSDILYNLSLALATNSKSLKNCIRIRILSLNEYDKYILNGTCDGSIIKGNDNVWNKLVPQSYTNNLFISWSRENKTVNHYTYFENYSDNITNITPRKYTYSINIGACYAYPENNGSWIRANRTSSNNDNKNLSIINSNITAYKGSSTTSSFDNPDIYVYYVGIRVYYKEYKTFRPIFNIIDNNKSSGSYY